ncbi:MAG TPA: UDP-N-acetylglucosamine 2-epimerase (non-hydrolyzing) [Bryobacteraceae bacterium]|nr:UDP-N-acetylglucosamine 2-epimerase (non-hydrolyzing) [Bryobacteraceae bacterium]
MKLICVAGARPNFVKVAPIIRLLSRSSGFQAVLVHTGQHYDEAMSGSFFRDLGIPLPDHHLEVGSGAHAEQTAEILKRFDDVLESERPDGVIVVGDVNSTMACSLAAKKRQVVLIHIEAGLRSFDRNMPEEINRLVTDSISDLLLVTENSGRTNLLREGVPESRIHMVGNLMIDTLLLNLERARQSSIARTLGIERGPFGLVTLHRPSNVDAPRQLLELMEALAAIANDLPLYFPVHPRTRTRLASLSLESSRNLHLIDPLGYLDFLCLMSLSKVVLTDSGGIQEETTALGIPCLTLRNNTERPITIEEGTNLLAGTSKESIAAAWQSFSSQPKSGRVPALWDGHAARRCLGVISRFFGVPLPVPDAYPAPAILG